MNITNKPIQKLEGCYTAIITPMLKGDGQKNMIHYEKLYELIDQQINAGVDGIVVAGTTGQSSTLTLEEQVDFIELVHAPFEPINLIASAGSNSTRDAITLSREIEDRIGPTTLLHITPYYNKPPQEGLIRHYTEIADRVKGNIIMYNVPSRTGVDMTAETTIQLAKHPKIIGIKEATTNMQKIEKICKETDPEHFRLLSGEDGLVYEMMKQGAYGVISASANIAPRLFSEITHEYLKGNHELAKQLQKKAEPLVGAVFATTNPIPLAYMLNTNLRLPLTGISDKSIQEQIDNTLARYNSLELGINLKKIREIPDLAR